MKDIFEAIFVSNPVFDFLLNALTAYPLVVIAVGIVVALIGCLMLRRRRHDPGQQVQPAAATVTVGVLIALASPVTLLISNAMAA